MDAAGIGAVAALRSAKLPEFDKETGKIVEGKHTEEGIPLAENTTLPITIHKIGNSLIVDPTKEEEDISETRITIGSSNGVIASMQKGKEASLSIEELHKAIEIATNTWKDIFKKLDKSLN